MNKETSCRKHHRFRKGQSASSDLILELRTKACSEINK
jgi:hypothetical protein